MLVVGAVLPHVRSINHTLRPRFRVLLGEETPEMELALV